MRQLMFVERGRVEWAEVPAPRLDDENSVLVRPLAGPWPRRFRRAAITVCNTDDPQGLITTLRSTDDYGTCTSTAIFFGPQPSLPLLEMYTKGITLHLSRADSRRYTPEIVDLAASGRLDTGAVTTTVAGWEDAPAAWLTPATKLVLTRSQRER